MRYKLVYAPGFNDKAWQPPHLYYAFEGANMNETIIYASLDDIQDYIDENFTTADDSFLKSTRIAIKRLKASNQTSSAIRDIYYIICETNAGFCYDCSPNMGDKLNRTMYDSFYKTISQTQ